MRGSATVVSPDHRVPRREVESHAEGPQNEDQWKRLQKYNVILCIVHAILAVIFRIYFNKVLNSTGAVSGINLSLYDHVFKADPSNPDGPLQVISEVASDVREETLGNLIVSFFAITSAFHLIYAVNPGDVYLNGVKRGNNYLRWLEYSVTATIMLFIIAILSGVKDIKSYFTLVASGIGMIATGQWFETAIGNARWVPIITGFVLLMGAFLTIWTSFRDRLRDADEAGVKVPKWLWFTLIILFMFYASFGFVPIAKMLFPSFSRGLKYEYTYLTLSLASKATLGMLVAYGFGQRASSTTPS